MPRLITGKSQVGYFIWRESGDKDVFHGANLARLGTDRFSVP